MRGVNSLRWRMDGPIEQFLSISGPELDLAQLYPDLVAHYPKANFEERGKRIPFYDALERAPSQQSQTKW